MPETALVYLRFLMERKMSPGYQLPLVAQLWDAYRDWQDHNPHKYEIAVHLRQLSLHLLQEDPLQNHSVAGWFQASRVLASFLGSQTQVQRSETVQRCWFPKEHKKSWGGSCPPSANFRCQWQNSTWPLFVGHSPAPETIRTYERIVSMRGLMPNACEGLRSVKAVEMLEMLEGWWLVFLGVFQSCACCPRAWVTKCQKQHVSWLLNPKLSRKHS